MKGIILAGGSGTRLYPLTAATNKLLLPIYDKPMIYYPLSTLMLAGIRDILLVSRPDDLESFRRLLGDGGRYGIRMSFTVQPEPLGIAHAFIIGEDFIGDDRCALILGDNIFYGDGLDKYLHQAMEQTDGSTVFAVQVTDPERFGVVNFDDTGKVISIEEKPKAPKSNYAVTGLYFYDKDACRLAKTLKPSARGEIEITDLNKLYLNENKLNVITLDSTFQWFDTGTIDAMNDAANFIRKAETSGIACVTAPEMIGYANGWLSRDALEQEAKERSTSEYGKLLRMAIEGLS